VHPTPDKHFTSAEIATGLGGEDRKSPWYVAVYDMVYEVSGFLLNHPGGVAVLQSVAGTDATATFEEAGHMKKTIDRLMPQWCVGYYDRKSIDTTQQKTYEAVASLEKLMPSMKVKTILQTSKDTRLITFENTSAENKQGLCDIPLGQHLRVFVAPGQSKPYTPIVSTPDVTQLVVKVYPGGNVSGYLGSLSVGDIVKYKGPFGRMEETLMEDKEQIYMRAMGTGIAPLYQLIKYQCDQWEQGMEVQAHVHVICCYRTTDDILLYQELDALVTEHKNKLSISYVVSTKTDQDGGFAETHMLFAGMRLSLPVIKAQFTELEELVSTKQEDKYHIFLCGSKKFQAEITHMLTTELRVENRKCFAF
jgi:NAD(P)H-flavin reductase